MPKSASRARWLKFLGMAISVALVLILGVVLATSNRQRRVLRTPNGCIIKLERYEFKSGTVRYYLPEDLQDRPVLRAALGILPDGLIKRLTFLPQPRAFIRSSSPTERLLSVAFSTQNPIGKGRRWSPIVSRVIISDDRGQLFDGVLNYMGSSGVLSLEVFPRRGRELQLRPVLMGDDSGVVFKIPNPCPGPHPVWKAEPLPMSATNSSLRVTLESFVSDRAQARTRCVFRVKEDRGEGPAWLPVSFEVSDATGNHWNPAIDRVQSTNGHVNCSFFGALWPDEAAWKVRVEFKLVAKQAASPNPCAVEFLAKPEQFGEAPAPSELNGNMGGL